MSGSAPTRTTATGLALFGFSSLAVLSGTTRCGPASVFRGATTATATSPWLAATLVGSPNTDTSNRPNSWPVRAVEPHHAPLGAVDDQKLLGRRVVGHDLRAAEPAGVVRPDVLERHRGVRIAVAAHDCVSDKPMHDTNRGRIESHASITRPENRIVSPGISTIVEYRRPSPAAANRARLTLAGRASRLAYSPCFGGIAA